MDFYFFGGDFMMERWKFVSAVAVVGLLAGSLMAAPSPHFKVFLCFGQSNMSGGTQVAPDAASQKTNPRIKALGFATSTCGSVSRTANKWSDACEPMHCGDGIASMGPSYAFGQAIADSLPDDTIGLIPAGLWGVSIEMFMKGKTNTSSSKPSVVGNNAWDWMVTKCKAAVERGEFSGIILEQGESNSGDGVKWLGKVKSIYNDLKTELQLKNDVPLVAGELLQASGNCCSALNSSIDKIKDSLPNAFFASSKDLAAGGDQKQYHFNQAAYRTLGQRMAVEMMKGLKIPIQVQPQYQRVISATSVNSQRGDLKVYSLDGRFISTAAAMTKAASLRPGSIYVVANNPTGAAVKLMVAPSAQ